MKYRQWSMIVFVLLVLGACAAPQNVDDHESGLKVVATTTIVADLLTQIGGDDIEVVALMGAGVDPHLYKPSAGDVGRLSTAKAVFYSGLHLEGKMSEVLEEIGTRGVTTIAVGECVPSDQLIETAGFSTVHDPHVWFDVKLWMHAADCVGKALADLDPANAASYQQRAAAYHEELVVLDAWIHQRVEALTEAQRVLITAHDAFAYFGRAYDFEVRGLLGVSTASEAGAADVRNLADFISERQIPAIFVETSVSPRFLQALQEAVNGRGLEVKIGGTLYSDALGDPGSAAATYIGTVRANIDTIVGALETE